MTVIEAQQIILQCDEELPSPITTPGSVVDDEKSLVPYAARRNNKPNKKWFSKQDVPVAIFTVSVLEIIFYIAGNENLQRLLRFEPYKLYELWRFVTYMLIHEDLLHLVLNVLMQIIFAYFLEVRHGRLRILFLYLAGGSTGVLGASCFQPDLVIGASAGVYSLLISHVADIVVNFESMKYKIYRIMCIVTIVISDIIFNLIHIFSKEEPLISWGAHVIGGISGLLLGLLLFKRDQPEKSRKIWLYWTGLGLYLSLIAFLVILTFQIKRCTPSTIIRTRYIYFC